MTHERNEFQEQLGDARVTELTLEQQLAEAASLIDLQAGKITAARRALQQDQPKHALDILT